MTTKQLGVKVAALAAAAGLLCFAYTRTFEAEAETPGYSNGVVVSVDPIASNVGMEVLKKGGHAVDAGGPTGLALAVIHADAGILGGDGFMLITLAGGQATSIDYREKAPEKSTPTMFLTNGEVDQKKS